MGKRLLAGVCLLAFVVGSTGIADAARKKARIPLNCAQPTEITAIQVTAVQQQLMVAALSCDPAGIPDTDKQFVSKFNQFQIAYGPELRQSDANMLKMFKMRRFFCKSLLPLIRLIALISCLTTL